MKKIKQHTKKRLYWSNIRKVYSQDDPHFHIAMEGSPRNYGFKTQKEFIDRISCYEVEEMRLTRVSVDKCEMLVTDNINSTSDKMKQMKQMWGVNYDERICTYEDILSLFSEHFRRDKILKLMKKSNKHE